MMKKKKENICVTACVMLKCVYVCICAILAPVLLPAVCLLFNQFKFIATLFGFYPTIYILDVQVLFYFCLSFNYSLVIRSQVYSSHLHRKQMLLIIKEKNQCQRIEIKLFGEYVNVPSMIISNVCRLSSLKMVQIPCFDTRKHRFGG